MRTYLVLVTQKFDVEFRRKQTADLIGWDGDLKQDGFWDSVQWCSSCYHQFND